MHAVDPTPPPVLCSALSADEPLPGTAAQERTWVLLEVPGGWGRDVLSGGALDASLASGLTAHLAACGARLLFIRRPGREGQSVDRPVLHVCDTAPGGVVRTRTVGSAAELLDLDLSPEGHLPDSRVVTAPLALVCTHGKRDRCCALLGRPVAAELDRRLGARLVAADPHAGVWECSHTGGHRFAPILLLPDRGYTYGSTEIEHYAAAVEAAWTGGVSTEGLRGRSTWSPPGQVAEVAVRASGVAAGRDDLRVTVPGDGRADDGSESVVVDHVDGRSWRVVVRRDPLPPRPASCGKAPGKAWGWSVVSLHAD